MRTTGGSPVGVVSAITRGSTAAVISGDPRLPDNLVDPASSIRWTRWQAAYLGASVIGVIAGLKDW